MPLLICFSFELLVLCVRGHRMHVLTYEVYISFSLFFFKVSGVYSSKQGSQPLQPENEQHGRLS